MTMNHNRSWRKASRITPRIYLSDLYTASNEDEVTNLGITHVISVVECRPTLPTSITPEQTLHFPIADRPHVDILRHLETTTNFISSALAQNESNKVLVHCHQGISRSATVVCAYLVATTAMSASESIAHVKELRRIVWPNRGFRKQLDVYGTRFVGKRSSQSPVEKISKNPEPASNTGPEQNSK